MFFEMRFDLGTLDSGERSLPFGLLVGYPKIELWISKKRIMDILNSAGFLDIQKWIFGYPKIH